MSLGEDPKRWAAFAAELSKITGLPLKKEEYCEQFDGKLLMKTPDEQASAKRHYLKIIIILLIISFIGALIYKTYGTFRAFILIGCGTVVINIALSFIYVFLYRDNVKPLEENNFITVVCILTLLIPYALLYLFFSHLLTGFRWPLSN